MSKFIDIIQDPSANVSITIGLTELGELATLVAEGVVKRLRDGMPAAEEFLTVKQVCEMLGVSAMTLYRWHNLGYLNKIKIGNSVRYRKSDINALNNNQHGNI